MQKSINIYDESSVKGMYDAGTIAASTLDMAREFLKTNQNRKTSDIDMVCENFIRSQNATPECIGYMGYKHASCISVNDVACHGIPGDYILQNGDVVNIDIVARFGEWLGDTSFSIGIGDVSPANQKLIEVAQNAMYAGMRVVQKFKQFNIIGHSIEMFCKSQSFNGEKFYSMSGYCGHGISKTMHEGPYVEHTKNQCTVMIKPYHFFTIEPIVILGANTSSYIENDGWTVRSKSKRNSLQFEHTMGLDENNNLMIFTTRDLDHELQILKILFGQNALKRFRGKRY
jgi:methionyl aminopeptidase